MVLKRVVRDDINDWTDHGERLLGDGRQKGLQPTYRWGQGSGRLATDEGMGKV